jgi:hypothetical protein
MVRGLVLVTATATGTDAISRTLGGGISPSPTRRRTGGHHA